VPHDSLAERDPADYATPIIGSRQPKLSKYTHIVII
jgi:hypothetical protein